MTEVSREWHGGEERQSRGRLVIASRKRWCWAAEKADPWLELICHPGRGVPFGITGEGGLRGLEGVRKGREGEACDHGCVSRGVL